MVEPLQHVQDPGGVGKKLLLLLAVLMTSCDLCCCRLGSSERLDFVLSVYTIPCDLHTASGGSVTCLSWRQNAVWWESPVARGEEASQWWEGEFGQKRKEQRL